jgi:hypothetical protein
MPGKLTKEEEVLWRKAKKTVLNGKKPKKKDWPLIMHVFTQMKNASSIRVEPYEQIIEDGVKLVEKVYGSGFFSGINEIIVEHNMGHHYGRVFADRTDKIYVSGDRIKSEFSADHFQQVFQIGSTLVHEMAHIKDKMQNGEAPAVAAEGRFVVDLQNKTKSTPDFIKEFSKQASLAVTAKPEDSGVGADGARVYVTTVARIIFRKTNPEWAHVPNSFLNPVIAAKFAELPVVKQFKAKESSATGEIRGDKQNRITAIRKGSIIAIVAIKGSFKIPSPAKTAGRDDDLRAQRGWMEDHFFDLFVGQLALDDRSSEFLKDYIDGGIGMETLMKMSPDQASQMARAVLSEDQHTQMSRDPGWQSGAMGSTSLPVSFSY